MVGISEAIQKTENWHARVVRVERVVRRVKRTLDIYVTCDVILSLAAIFFLQLVQIILVQEVKIRQAIQKI